LTIKKMTARQLKAARCTLFPGRGGIAKMAEALGGVSKRTYEKWEYGPNPVTAPVSACVKLLLSNHAKDQGGADDTG